MRFLSIVFGIVAVFFFAAVSVSADAEKSVCLLPKEVGPCRSSDRVFYYNSAAKECQEFLYGGCHGNDNRFHSRDECEKTCL